MIIKVFGGHQIAFLKSQIIELLPAFYRLIGGIDDQFMRKHIQIQNSACSVQGCLIHRTVFIGCGAPIGTHGTYAAVFKSEYRCGAVLHRAVNGAAIQRSPFGNQAVHHTADPLYTAHQICQNAQGINPQIRQNSPLGIRLIEKPRRMQRALMREWRRSW